ncbi:MAG: hypothetical protein ACI9XR_002607, partial [Flavobacterium sp.]
MKNNFNFFVHFLFTIFSFSCFAQHDIKLVVAVNKKSNSLQVYQTVTYHNQSKDTLTSIYFNDWNNAYSDKNSALGKRFSDEFVRSFHLASEEDRGATSNLTIFDDNKSFYAWNRLEKDVDLL